MYEQVIVPPDRSDFADAALPVAESLAKAFGAQLELIHVTFIRSPTAEQAYLEAVASAMSVEHVVTRVEYGWPVPVLAELVQSRSNPLVCLATHGRWLCSTGSTRLEPLRLTQHHCRRPW